MAAQPPKYQAIHAVLRQQILDGELAPGSRLPPQQEMADRFGVTLMTLRQAISNLESEGLVWAARGKGTFVAERPVDISLGNLSSFAQQMSSTGVEVSTELLDVAVVQPEDHAAAVAALEVAGPIRCLTRSRSFEGQRFSLQRSYLDESIQLVGAGGRGTDDDGGADDGGADGLEAWAAVATSLYDAIEAATGWTVAEARESMTAVDLGPDDAHLVSTEVGHPALLSIRTSINQFGKPFLYDEALLVGGRCSITADRTADRLSLRYDVE